MFQIKVCDAIDPYYSVYVVVKGKCIYNLRSRNTTMKRPTRSLMPKARGLINNK